MMSTPVLTIIVPTYNRSANLEILLKTLREETKLLEQEVIVHVSDNCSPDDTAKIVAGIKESWPELSSHRHDKNIGPDGNFLHAVSQVKTRWFWIIGDDDLPKRGVVAKIVALLKMSQPSLLYMESEWIKPVLDSSQGSQVSELSFLELDAAGFADSLHVWVTFISGMVVKKSALPEFVDEAYMRKFSDTNLIQLSWILPLLKTAGPFIFVNQKCILATKENSGGYALLTVFGVNFAAIVKEILGENSKISKYMIRGNLFTFMPGLVWASRGMNSTFKKEDPWVGMRKELGSYLSFWFVLVPIGKFPRFISALFFLLWRIVNKTVNIYKAVLKKMVF